MYADELSPVATPSLVTENTFARLLGTLAKQAGKRTYDARTTPRRRYGAARTLPLPSSLTTLPPSPPPSSSPTPSLIVSSMQAPPLARAGSRPRN